MSARSRLIEWFEEHQRDLPWRHTRDPYAIWVSEVMLQQTRVDTVLPYYLRFMERFPDPTSLARADEDDVLSLWSGLGYYRRARLLHAGVREVVARYRGRVPEEVEARRSLPGIGRYTAGAIGSIAFDREEAIVDGNVARVLARRHGIATPLGRRDTEDELWKRAGELVCGERPGDLNQALMELGAMVCTPRNPNCAACPIRSGCVARETERQHELPMPRERKAPRLVSLSAVIAKDGDRVWLHKGQRALFGGLFGVPMHEGHERGDAQRALSDLGLRGRLGKSAIGRLEHVLTHRRLDVQVWIASAISRVPLPLAGGASGGLTKARSPALPLSRKREGELRLLAKDELDTVGVSTLTRRILEHSA